ncbi:hypothetical protein BDP27DRAFT_1450623 [Rhodocollybia butyracea]|uniref:DUF6534 domain-containing protein n=1 Tax=Rhodocollybia butyracea TaxID=206335 RepID=A0A9P5PK52_9AGAR|nr:hypothetical protein BDP27DRAFT_1450623 [Rhodocollybia butyracea]
MVSPLAPTYGIWLTSMWLATILYGMGLLQTWLYFHWYSQDHWGVRMTVICLIVFETLQITFFFGATYAALINNFGDFPALFVITWVDSAQLLAGYLSAFTVQMYFAYCLYLLNKKHKIVTVLIMALALTQIGAGVAQTIKTTILGSFLTIDSTKQITSLQSASALACDLVITVALYQTLKSKKNGLKDTNTLLQKLMINAINRGALTAVAAAINLTLFLALPGTFYFFLGLMTSSKLYMNSMLATLNTRQHIMRATQSSDHAWNSIHLAGLSTASSETGTQMVTRLNRDGTELAGIESGIMKPNFVENMI